MTTTKVAGYDKTSHFYLRLSSRTRTDGNGAEIKTTAGMKFGVIAMGLKGDRITITGSACSVEDVHEKTLFDEYDIGESLSIAYGRLAHAAVNKDTRRVEIALADVANLSFETVVKKLGLFKNQFITDWQPNPNFRRIYAKDGVARPLALSAEERGVPGTEGTWTKVVLDGSLYDQMIQHAAHWLTLQPPVPDQLILDMEKQIADIQAKITARKRELREIRKAVVSPTNSPIPA